MTKTLDYTEVFVPGGYPKYTYNPRITFNLENRVGEVLHNLCKLVIVTGHTKSGKTVLVQKILPREKTIWIDGGAVRNEDNFWTIIVDQLKLFQTTEIQESKETTMGISSEISGEGNLFIAKGGAKVGASIGTNEGAYLARSREVSSNIAALAGLRKTHRPLVIDDFHYLPRELQGDVVRALKPLIFDGLPVVVIAIPHRRYDAIKVEKEMTGRILPVNIPLWSEEELEFIPETGFRLLERTLDLEIIKQSAKESIGSPHLMQEFCRAIGKILTSTTVSSSEHIYITQSEEIEKIFRETAETIGRPIFEKLASGPRQRSDRIPRSLKTGKQVDIYGLVLHGLSHIRPGLVTLEYEELRTAIKNICLAETVPQLHEIARVLKYMSEIAATDQSSTPVIDFDEEDKRLHITDPFFAFYLRWGNIDR